VSAPLEQRHVDILARDVLNRRVACLAEDQGFACIGYYRPADRDYDPFEIALYRDGWSGPGILTVLVIVFVCSDIVHLLQFSWRSFRRRRSGCAR